MGPYALAANSQGAYVRPWRAWVEQADGSGAVYLGRANEDNTAWEEPDLLFLFTGPEIQEIDLAFDQNGNVTLCADREFDGNMQVWLYWYDSREAAHVFSSVVTGRTGRLVLDDPGDFNESDLILFYINDATQRIQYRLQRDFYETPGDVPTDRWFNLDTGLQVDQPITVNMFLEDVARTVDNRLHVIASHRNPVTGTYELLVIETVSYPIRIQDALYPTQSITNLMALLYVLAPRDTIESMAPIQSVQSLVTISLIVFVGASGPDGYTPIDSIAPTQRVLSLSREDLLLVYAVPFEAIGPQQRMQTMTVVTSVIVMNNPATESIAPSQAIQSLTVV